MKYVQSFYQYAVTFSSIGKSVPAKDADGELRNIAEFEDSEIETLQKNEPLFRRLVDLKKYRVLNKLPESYKPAAAQINEARAEAAALRAELEALRAEKGEATKDAATEGEAATDAPAENEAAGDKQDLSELSYKELQDLAAERGVNYKNVKKADLIAALSK